MNLSTVKLYWFHNLKVNSANCFNTDCLCYMYLTHTNTEDSQSLAMLKGKVEKKRP